MNAKNSVLIIERAKSVLKSLILSREELDEDTVESNLFMIQQLLDDASHVLRSKANDSKPDSPENSNNKEASFFQGEACNTLMDWAHDITCSSASLWLLLERMTSEDEIREHALITIVVKTLEDVTKRINKFEASHSY